MATPRKQADPAPHLEVVKATTRSRRPPAKVKTVAEAAKTGTRRELLVAMRDRIALAVADPKCPPRDLSSLSLRLEKLSEQIEAIDLAAQQEENDGAIVDDGDFDASAV